MNLNFANKITGEIVENLPAVDISKGVATPSGLLFGASAADVWRYVLQPAGWRRVASVEACPVGYRVAKYGVDQIDSESCALYCDQIINLADEAAAQAEAAAAAAQADLVANAERYTLENAYLMLCDRLHGNTAHAKIGVSEMAASMAALRVADYEAYGKLRDALSLIDSGLQRYDTRWWDTVQYRDVPVLVAAAANLLEKM